jgi:hypothetical protein
MKKLTKNIGEAKKGEVYVRGVHGKIDRYSKSSADQFYWLKGSKKEDNAFLPAHVFDKSNSVDI